jgi:adenylate cyclase
MSAPSVGFWQRRGSFGLYELLQSWWRHRVSFLISVAITLVALCLYYFTFFGEHPTPLFRFLQRVEFNSLDTRFRLRPPGSTPPDPRIVIVEIDQKSQEVFGKWPFSRSHFATLLDALHDDGARVAAFDVTFDKPDRTADPVRALSSDLEVRKMRGEPVDPRLEKEVRNLAVSYDADAKFAKSLNRFGNVVLGNFFLTPDQLRGIDPATLDQYNELIEWFSIGRNAIHAETGKRDFQELISRCRREDLVFAANVANIPALANPDNSEKISTGFFNEPSDPDGVVRQSLLVLPFGRSKDPNEWQMYGSLEVQAVRQYLGVRADQVSVQFDETGIVRLDLGDALRLKTDSTGRSQINYHGSKRTYPYFSMADVAQHHFPAGSFRDKIVLIGASATGIADLRTPPYGENDYPGVEIHANVIDNIFHQNFLVRGAAEQLYDALLILFFGLPLGVWMALVAPRWMWLGIFLFLPLLALDYAAFMRGSWLNFTIPAFTLGMNVLMISLYRSLFEEKEKRRVRSAFGQYLSPEVIRRLLINPDLVEPRKTEITVMFSDIRGFTTISEQLDAQELALFLNQYLSDMTRLVFEQNGTLDKYIGDAVMAFWGAPFEEPGHAAKACNTALNMMSRVRELQEIWEAQGKPRLDIGIGLNTGVASVGNMGSALRYGYTALGDSVNLSSRLEGLNKDYGTHILVNESTFTAAGKEFLFRELDLIRVKGKLQPVIIYELICRTGESSNYGSHEEMHTLLARFREARTLYQNRQWADAQAAFMRILEKFPEDGPSRAYWKRCQEYLFDEPPSGWDGVFTMTHK